MQKTHILALQASSKALVSPNCCFIALIVSQVDGCVVGADDVACSLGCFFIHSGRRQPVYVFCFLWSDCHDFLCTDKYLHHVASQFMQDCAPTLLRTAATIILLQYYLEEGQSRVCSRTALIPSAKLLYNLISSIV